jgi:hypothetical protein
MYQIGFTTALIRECQYLALTPFCLAKGRINTLPIVRKEIDWALAEVSLDLKRLPESLRVIYPTFYSPQIRLMAADYDDYFPIETSGGQVGWERAIREAYSFIVSRSRHLDNHRYNLIWHGKI